MAKRYDSRQRHETGNTITTPSQFGSHRVMVVDPDAYVLSEESRSQLGQGSVLCKDDRGFYITLEDRLDTGLADPKRYSGQRLNLTEKE